MPEIKKSNPLRILEALDGFLKEPFELIVYGRSALALGYPQPPAKFMATMDVDAILPLKDLAAIEANDDFWEAQDKVNEMFVGVGLYFTHLFEERQVLLTPNWLKKVVPLTALGFERLRLKRPSTHDLVLTKMMRVDPQDREDIEFLLKQGDFSWSEFESCLRQANCPGIPEIEDAFRENTAWIQQLKPKGS